MAGGGVDGDLSVSGIIKPVPPLLKAYRAVMVRVNLLEEAVELRLGHHQAGLCKGATQLRPVQLAVVVPVDAVEQRAQLLLGLFHERPEF